MTDIGFITNCLSAPFEKKIEIASNLGFSTLEVACWEKGSIKQCDIDADHVDQAVLKRIKRILLENHITISCLAYYENILSPDLTLRNKYISHLINVIHLAHALNVPNIGTYLGKNSLIPIEDNFSLANDIFQPILEYADALNVTILIENCPMPTWSKEGYPSTISYSPELLEKMFELFPNQNLGLNFDPSHLYWQGIDYLQVARDVLPHIKSVHIKDVTTIHNQRNYSGIYGKKINKKVSNDFGYYEATVPGYGDIKWLDLLQILKQGGFTGPLQVEYKSGNGFGKIESVERGLQLSCHYLQMIQKLEV